MMWKKVMYDGAIRWHSQTQSAPHKGKASTAANTSHISYEWVVVTQLHRWLLLLPHIYGIDWYLLLLCHAQQCRNLPLLAIYHPVQFLKHTVLIMSASTYTTHLQYNQLHLQTLTSLHKIGVANLQQRTVLHPLHIYATLWPKHSCRWPCAPTQKLYYFLAVRSFVHRATVHIYANLRLETINHLLVTKPALQTHGCIEVSMPGPPLTMCSRYSMYYSST